MTLFAFLLSCGTGRLGFRPTSCCNGRCRRLEAARGRRCAASIPSRCGTGCGPPGDALSLRRCRTNCAGWPTRSTFGCNTRPRSSVWPALLPGLEHGGFRHPNSAETPNTSTREISGSIRPGLCTVRPTGLRRGDSVFSPRPCPFVRIQPPPIQPRRRPRCQKKLDEAIACYRKAIELDPKYAIAYPISASPCATRGSGTRPLPSTASGSRLDPKDAQAYVNLSGTLDDRRKPEEAIAVFRQGLERCPIMPGCTLHWPMSSGSKGGSRRPPPASGRPSNYTRSSITTPSTTISAWCSTNK